ncbi:MAG: EF-P lysine aminoacylase GenX, partial [Gammaproteobacteria bacterium]|nr:EF-P lysine aminoacylase GenX [Gammaproteobacteria bacterium]
GFFAKRNVVEVETPLLLPTTNPSPYLDSFSCDGLYLQTSPEFAMKRLLAEGSDDIYQICKAFRKEESGKLHNPEFTILEWYRISFDHLDLMNEVDELLTYITNSPKAKRYTYAEVCEKFLEINPHTCSLTQLKSVAKKHDLLVSGLDDEPDIWLQLLFTHLIEPNLCDKRPVFVYDFPETQAMLARVRNGKIRLASRFEVYYKGIELANGFHELKDPKEQLQRFNEDLLKRKKLNLPSMPIDQKLLAALPKLPNCSGVALGIDRLILLASDQTSLDSILCFRD